MSYYYTVGFVRGQSTFKSWQKYQNFHFYLFPNMLGKITKSMKMEDNFGLLRSVRSFWVAGGQKVFRKSVSMRRTIFGVSLPLSTFLPPTKIAPHIKILHPNFCVCANFLPQPKSSVHTHFTTTPRYNKNWRSQFSAPTHLVNYTRKSRG
jgi:hypothetical protein